jgi:hypothetical protein
LNSCPEILDDLYPLFALPTRKWMPRKKKGKTLSRFTALRWALHGRRGVKLRTIMVGGIRCTCDAWAMQFFERLTSGDNGGKPLTGGRQSKDHEAAERELAAAGVV